MPNKSRARKVGYTIGRSGEFIIENYGFAKPFSSFFPGVAGLCGIPLWAFYVNRGQCICSFGTRDKDHAIAEFLPADRAYRVTALQGFRTFIKIAGPGKNRKIYEPFLNDAANLSRNIVNRMIITPYDLSIEEINHDEGIKVLVKYFPVPGEPIGAIARTVGVENIGRKKIAIEVLDGLAKVVPYGMDNFCLKNLSRTIESMMKVSNYTENGIPFFHLKTEPEDRPEVVVIKSGNFYFNVKPGRSKNVLVSPVVDPACIFGQDTELLYPRNFADKTPFRPARQILENRTPCAMAHFSFELSGGGRSEFYALAGYADDVEKLNSFCRRVVGDKNYFDRKAEENRGIITGLTDHTGTLSGIEAFDLYVRQNFLDNILRGGFPLAFKTVSGKEIFYVYSRKHGDLERDYNNYIVAPTYFSQGNGNYRDINQNRRNDVFFNPEVADSNIILFMNMLQADAFNPHILKRLSFSYRGQGLARELKGCLCDPDDISGLTEFIKGPFDPGELFKWIEDKKIRISVSDFELLDAVLSVCQKEEDIVHGEGFWSDHWHYNNDLLESYLGVFPEKLRYLLFENTSYTFFDNDHRVLPRREKYVVWGRRIRQMGSVAIDPEKTRLISERTFERNKMRLDHGKGDVFRTNLFVKLICVVANKICSLDSQGIGIEMESDKPNWNDSLNGLPAIFGSSTSETYELCRLADFLLASLEKAGVPIDEFVFMPEEIAWFFSKAGDILKEHLGDNRKEKNFIYWDRSAELKEEYREKIRFGFSGVMERVALGRTKDILSLVVEKLMDAVGRSFDKKKGIYLTYFRAEAEKYDLIYEKDGKTPVCNTKGMHCVRVRSFRQIPLPLFLEGPVHMMRIMKEKKEVLSLYRSIRRSSLFDKKLGMYKVSSSIIKEPLEIGRIRIFAPGWLENESVWLHMEYKFLLELLRNGLYEEFYSSARTCLVPFLEPATYGRSIAENSSFICSSAFPDSSLHGSGFVARLSGSTAEFIHIWLLMVMGPSPFALGEEGKLALKLRPALEARFFTKRPGELGGVKIAKNSFAFMCLRDTLIVYRNPEMKPTFGRGCAAPRNAAIQTRDGRHIDLDCADIPHPYAEWVREGKVKKIEIFFK